jgi:UPF0176 protein
MLALALPITVAAFYKFVPIEDVAELRSDLLALGTREELKGSILVAAEGINATVSAAPDAMERFLHALKKDARFYDLAVKISSAPRHPFGKFKVRLKREIVTLGVPEANPNERVGAYVSPSDWNGLISDPCVTVIDTRNVYEYEIGTFERAINPKTRSFGEFPQYVRENLDPRRHKRIAMFCTGGIRCEKATAFMLNEGFPEVYHLEGGILRYLEEIPPEQSLWRGECFVFDERVALSHGVRIGTHTMCPSCGRAIPKGGGDAPAACERCRKGMPP